MAAIKMQVNKRTDIGKNSIKKLRKDNEIPAVVYSKGAETVHIKVNSSEFSRVYRLAGGTALLELELEGEKIPAIVKDLQRHPVKNEILHIDFQKLNMDEKIKLTIPVVLVNRDSIRLQPSILMQLLDQVEVECLPAHIPNTADVDVQDMDFNTPILVKDLDIAKDENITVLRDLDDVVCTLAQPSMAVEDEEEEETSISEDGEAAEEEVQSEE
ncbi:MAG: 50S ribosomal protein L25 [Tissierellaceae bacterium]